MATNSKMKAADLKSLVMIVALALLLGCTSDKSTASGTDGLLPAYSQESILGAWGGEGILVTIALEGATIEWNCADGTIDAAIIPDSEGRFQSEGIFTPRGGMEPIAGRPHESAIYTGTIVDDSMTLIVTIPDEPHTLGPFNLIHGATVHFVRCY